MVGFSYVESRATPHVLHAPGQAASADEVIAATSH